MSKKDFSIAILVTAIWGSNFSVIKLGLNQLDPFLLTAFRFILCAVPMCFFIERPKIQLRYIAAYGVIFGVGMWGVANLAIQIGLSAGIASLLLQFSAFFTIILSVILLKETIKPVQYIGILIAILGLFLILYITHGKAPLLGIVLILISAICWSVCNIIVKKHKPNEMISFIIWSSLFSAPPLLLVTYIVKGSEPFINLHNSLNGMAIFSILFQAYITTLFGYWVWNKLLKKYTASTVAPLSLLVPVFGLLTSHLIFNEVIDQGKVISSALIVIGIFILIYGQQISNIFSKHTE